MSGIANYTLESAIGYFEAGGKGYITVYNDTGSAISNGAIKLLSEKWITGIGVIMAMAAIATNGGSANVIGIVANNPSGSIANGEYGNVLVKGLYGSDAEGYGVTTSGTVAANDQLEILNATTVFIDSGNDGGAVWLDESCALAVEEVTTNVWAVYLHGRPCVVAGS